MGLGVSVGVAALSIRAAEAPALHSDPQFILYVLIQVVTVLLLS